MWKKSSVSSVDFDIEWTLDCREPLLKTNRDIYTNMKTVKYINLKFKIYKLM